MSNKCFIGKVVTLYSRDRLPERKGKIIGEAETKWGDEYIIQWENGQEEMFPQVFIKPIKEIDGPGIYYKD